jgi:hypothetical protein
MDIHFQVLNTQFLDEHRDENSPSYNFSGCLIFVGNAIEVECDVAKQCEYSVDSTSFNSSMNIEMKIPFDKNCDHRYNFCENEHKVECDVATCCRY